MVICIFGDSITWGAFDYKNGGWVGRLRNYFEEKDEEIEVYNLGVAGNKTKDLLARFENEVKVRKVDVIVFAIGINDVGRDEVSFSNNINKLYKMARKYSSKIVFIGLTRVDERKTKVLSFFAGKKYTNSRIEKLDEIIKDFCQKMDLKYIEVGDLIKNEDLVDGLHPNSTGHEKMYKRIRAELKNYLEIK